MNQNNKQRGELAKDHVCLLFHSSLSAFCFLVFKKKIIQRREELFCHSFHSVFTLFFLVVCFLLFASSCLFLVFFFFFLGLTVLKRKFGSNYLSFGFR